MEARKAVVERDTAAKKLDDVVFPNVQPPPMATRTAAEPEKVSAIVVGAFCEHNDQVHSLVDLLAAKAGAGAETETGLDNRSAVAFEKWAGLNKSAVPGPRRRLASTTDLRWPRQQICKWASETS
jgi:hypothetical protein